MDPQNLELIDEANESSSNEDEGEEVDFSKDESMNECSGVEIKMKLRDHQIHEENF